MALFLLWLFGAILLWSFEIWEYRHAVWPMCQASDGFPESCRKQEFLHWGEAFSLSLSNVFGFLGLSRTFLADELKTLTAASEIVSGTQTLFGIVFLFLLGLALRNRFRLK